MEQKSGSSSGRASEIAAGKIRGLRAEKRLTQREVAERAGLSFSTYRRIESGEYAIDLEQFDAVAGALEADPVSVLETAWLELLRERRAATQALTERQEKE